MTSTTPRINFHHFTDCIGIPGRMRPIDCSHLATNLYFELNDPKA